MFIRQVGMIVLLLTMMLQGQIVADEHPPRYGEALPLSVKLVAPESVRVGEPVDITMQITNEGSDKLRIPIELYCGAGFLTCEYRHDVVHDDLPRGDRGGIAGYFSRPLDQTVLLDPGAFYGRTITRRAYRRPVELRFRVHLHVPENDFPNMKKGWAESNWVTIQIVGVEEHN